MSEVQKKTLGIAIASLVLGILCLIPLLGLLFILPAIVLGIIALVKISKDKENLKGNGLAISGIVLGGVAVVVIPIVAMLAAIAIPNFLRARVNAYDASARAKIKTIATALETYRAANGRYPLGEHSLTSGNSPFISEPINNRVIMGYKYKLDLDNSRYTITAEPQNCGTTGNKNFKMTDSSELKVEPCSRTAHKGSSGY